MIATCSIDDIPENLFRQMVSCQTAANEFLRHFWASTSPPMADGPTLTLITPAQRATKATKMIGYLSKTHEKVAALILTAQHHGVDPGRIEVVSFSHLFIIQNESTIMDYRQCNLCSMRSIALWLSIAAKRQQVHVHETTPNVLTYCE